MFSIDKLRRYCIEHDIVVPAGAKREVYEAAITRAYLHLKKVEPDPEHGCFGYWSDEAGICKSCSYQTDCMTSSLGGLTKEEVDKAARVWENKKLKMTDEMTKKRYKRKRRIHGQYFEY